jgi:GNAT superfamily N-acetyltransferase
MILSVRRFRDTLGLLRSGQVRRLGRVVRQRITSEAVSLGLRRDLRVPFEAPPAKITVTVRRLEATDDLSFLDHSPDLDPDASWTRLGQRGLLGADLPTCWVAVDPDGRICYMQWLLTARDNARRAARWGPLFPELAKDEALLEAAYTPESHRGLGIMAHAMARIAESASPMGVRTAMTFVGAANVPSLKGCERAGFVPYVERVESWSLFRRRVRFAALS